MTAAPLTTCPEAEVFRHQAGAIHGVIHLQTAGVTQAESLRAPQPAGNSLNWVVGHLLAIYNNMLLGLGQERVASKEELGAYQRGSEPLDPSKALPLETLLALFDEAHARLLAGFGTLQTEMLDAAAPFSPTGNPNETMRTLISTVMFHQAYHVGQTALLRRLIGKEGAIK